MMRQIALLTRDVGLPQRGDNSSHEGEEHDSSHRDPDSVALNELDRAIAKRVLSRIHWTSFKMTANVIGELRNRHVATRRLLSQCFQNDVIQIAAEQFGIWTLGFGASTASSNGRAWPRWFLFRDGARDLRGVSALDAVWPLPCQ